MLLQLSHGLARVLGPELCALAWLLTYSIHSLIWAGAASLLTRWQAMSAATRHAAWKSALLAPIVTTVLITSATWSPAAARAGTSPAAHLAVLALRDASATPSPPSDARAPDVTVEPVVARRLGRALDLTGAAVLGAAALGLLRFGVAAGLLRRRLRSRRQLAAGRRFERLQKVRSRFGLGPVHLSESTKVDGPLVLGRAEICLPKAGLSELSDAELDAVFAHELAHLERGDGWWFPVVGLLQSAGWFHPVTRWVCAQVRKSAELACDARCVQLLGEPRALASALTHLASYLVTNRRAPTLPTMTQPRSSLLTRVAQLTSAGTVSALAPGRGRSRLLLGLPLLAAVSAGLSVRVVEARSSAARQRENVAELSRQMNALTARQLLLEAELEKLSRATSALVSEPLACARALEVEQEIRHTREMQQWLERRLMDE